MNDADEMVMIIWQCDKAECLEINRRYLHKGKILNDDTCEMCGRNIHEPIVEVITLNNHEAED